MKHRKYGELFLRPATGRQMTRNCRVPPRLEVGVPGLPPQENLSWLRLSTSSIPIPISSWGTALGDEARSSLGLGGEHSSQALLGLQPRDPLLNLCFAIRWLC